MRTIVITGTPGVGKSTLAKSLARKTGFYRLDLSKYYWQISTKYNKKKKCYDVDMKRLEKLVKEKLKERDKGKVKGLSTGEKIKEKKKKEVKGIIIDSHIAHLLPKKLIDLCLVLTCSDLKKLKRRLMKRKYSLPKIKENLEAEIFQVCLIEAKERGHKVKVVEVGKKGKEIVTKLTKSL